MNDDQKVGPGRLAGPCEYAADPRPVFLVPPAWANDPSLPGQAHHLNVQVMEKVGGPSVPLAEWLKDNCTWALWPDGTMCEIAEVGQYGHMSDDYARVVVTEYDETGTPLQWRRA
jgi:hypothetical protein